MRTGCMAPPWCREPEKCSLSVDPETGKMFSNDKLAMPSSTKLNCNNEKQKGKMTTGVHIAL